MLSGLKDDKIKLFEKNINNKRKNINTPKNIFLKGLKEF